METSEKHLNGISSLKTTKFPIERNVLCHSQTHKRLSVLWDESLKFPNSGLEVFQSSNTEEKDKVKNGDNISNSKIDKFNETRRKYTLNEFTVAKIFSKSTDTPFEYEQTDEIKQNTKRNSEFCNINI